MIHPFFKLLISDPGLLAQHASAYATLAQAEAADAAAELRRRALLLGGAALLGLVGVLAAVVAALLAAAVPLQTMPAAWLLAVLPVSLLGLAAGLVLLARSAPQPARFAALGAQWREDLNLLNVAGK